MRLRAGNWWWNGAEYPLGRNVGNKTDAQVYAIAAALQLAKDLYIRSKHSLKLIRVFTDDKELLDCLTRGNSCPIGPMGFERFPIRDLYERAAELVDLKVEVQLYWLKEHIGSEGYQRADEAAEQRLIDKCLRSSSSNARSMPSGTS